MLARQSMSAGSGCLTAASRIPAALLPLRARTPQAPRFVCHTASDGKASVPPPRTSADKSAKISLRDIVNQLEEKPKEGDKPKPWIVSRFLIFRKLTKRMRLRRLGRRFLPKLLARLGRGVIVALPAIGLFFVTSLAVSDYKRYKEERADGHNVGELCFGIATWADLVDVIAHVIALVGLVHIHYNFGIPIPPHIAHNADIMSPIIVLISFFSATVGEFLSAWRSAQAAASLDSSDESDMDEADLVAATA